MLNAKQLKELGIENWSTVAKNFNGADLLLGNGFSMNLAGHFNYKSLFKEFLKNCKPGEYTIFKSFGTNNFEFIQEILINAKKVNELFKIATSRRIDNAIELLKDGLIQSIQDTHPRSSQIDWNQLQQLSIQFNNFGDIFTLNYDLFLYHIILKMKDKSDEDRRDVPYSDYFWGKHDEQFRQFMNYDYPNRKHIYYLHGALFLFNKPPDTIKLIRGVEANELVDLIGDVINSGMMPLFVSEGKSEEKVNAINRSAYLTFARENLEKAKIGLQRNTIPIPSAPK